MFGKGHVKVKVLVKVCGRWFALATDTRSAQNHSLSFGICRAVHDVI